MSISLPTDVQNLYDTGHIAKAFLVVFELPGKTAAYTNSPRPIEFNSVTYLPNRYLEPLDGDSALGFNISTKTITFSNVPTDDVDDAIASVESYAYQNAPVTLTTLISDPLTGEIAGAASSSVFEVASVEFVTSAADDNGERLLTLVIELDPPGRAIREQTGVKRSLEEQQFDNDANDVGHQYSSSVAEWPRRWGRIQ